MKKSAVSLLSVLCLLLPAVSAAEEVWVAETSIRQSPGGYYSYYFSVKVGVWPVAPGHKVGMVWTNDRWATTQWTDLTWQLNQANAYGTQDEIWLTMPELYASDSAPVWFAVYVEDALGNRTWNNNGGFNFEIRRM